MPKSPLWVSVDSCSYGLSSSSTRSGNRSAASVDPTGASFTLVHGHTTLLPLLERRIYQGVKLLHLDLEASPTSVTVVDVVNQHVPPGTVRRESSVSHRDLPLEFFVVGRRLRSLHLDASGVEKDPGDGFRRDLHHARATTSHHDRLRRAAVAIKSEKKTGRRSDETISSRETDRLVKTQGDGTGSRDVRRLALALAPVSPAWGLRGET